MRDNYDPRKRKLLADEVGTQLTQAMSRRSDVTFEVRKNSTIVRFSGMQAHVPKGICPEPRHTYR